jgi:hypothetical protein
MIWIAFTTTITITRRAILKRLSQDTIKNAKRVLFPDNLMSSLFKKDWGFSHLIGKIGLNLLI